METVDIVISEDGETVEEYNGFDEAIQDEYCGQMAIAAGGTIAIGGLVTALLYACLAVSRIVCGSDTYTFTSSQAKGIVKSTGLGVTSSENHWAWYKVGSFFNHYHTANRNGAHSFYGIPK